MEFNTLILLKRTKVLDNAVIKVVCKYVTSIYSAKRSLL